MAKKTKIIIFSIIGVVLVASGLLILLLSKNKCPNGYTLLYDRCTKTEIVAPLVTKYCLDGYQLLNDTCTKTEYTAPKIDYLCDNTYRNDGEIVMSKSTLSGSKCSYKVTHAPVKKRKCLQGAEPYSDTKCRLTIITPAASRVDILTGKKMYYCGNGELNGTNCYIYGYSDYVYESVCVDGFKLIGDKCTKTNTYDANWKATCPSGYEYVDKNTCTRIVTSEVQYNYECPIDYNLVNKFCEKEIYYDK